MIFDTWKELMVPILIQTILVYQVGQQIVNQQGCIDGC